MYYNLCVNSYHSILRGKMPSCFFVTLCLCGEEKINNKKVKIRNKEVAVIFLE